jgi:hypothetical protein
MNKEDLKNWYLKLLAMPIHVALPNTVSYESAKAIVETMGANLDEFRTDFNGANRLGRVPKVRWGQDGDFQPYLNAERLFLGYVYETVREGLTDDGAAERHE